MFEIKKMRNEIWVAGIGLDFSQTLVAGETITTANATAKWGVTPTPNFLLDTLSISGTKVTVGLANYHQVGTFVVEISAETSLGNTYSDKITVHNE